MRHSTPAATAVRETLERLLASETFARSARARKLLTYLVERELAGEAHRLKGFAIAVDVFGKDADFDPATDAVVRVQAGRLRDLLNQYFAAEGAGEPLRIAVPRGSYVPVYEANPNHGPAASGGGPPREAPQSATARAPPPPTAPFRDQIRVVWAAIALVAAMLGVLFVRQGTPVMDATSPLPDIEAMATTASIQAASAMETLPVVYLSVKAEGPQVERVAAALRAGLSGFDTADFIGRDVDGDRPADPLSFVYELRPGPAPGGVTVELQSLASGRLLLSRSLGPQDAAPAAVDDRVADILSATMPVSGTIYTAIQQSGPQSGLIRCLLLSEAYYLDQNAASHETAYRCLEALADRDAKSPLVYAELASLELEAVTDRYPYPPDAGIAKASALAHKALQRGATSPNAHRAYGYLAARLGKPEESIRWMRKAYELNTYDLSMAAAYAYGLIFAGRYAEGTPIIARAADASSAHPTWWDFGLFVGAFMEGDMDRADAAAMALTTTAAKSHYLAARLIAAKATGDDRTRRDILAEIAADFPRFAADPRKVLIERKYPADLVDRLVEALRDAGLGNAT